MPRPRKNQVMHPGQKSFICDLTPQPILATASPPPDPPQPPKPPLSPPPPPPEGSSPFDVIRNIDENGEFWWASDLGKPECLNFSTKQKLFNVVSRAMESTKEYGLSVEDHFNRVVKMVQIGSGAFRSVSDYRLTRRACYLVAMVGDPRKPEIAAAQNYFVESTRRDELTRTTPTKAIRESVKRTQKRLGWSESHAVARDKGIDARNEFTSTLSRHGCEQQETYRIASEEINRGAVGMTSWELRSARDPNCKQTRNLMTERELIFVRLAEIDSAELIQNRNAKGDAQCIGCVQDTSQAVAIARETLGRQLRPPAA